MNTKEKLDLLWKYLLLVVLLYGFQMLGRQLMPPCGPHQMAGHPQQMHWFGSNDDNPMDIEVQVMKMDDGDSSMVITINGETIDLKGLNMQDMDLDDANVFIKKLKGSHKGHKNIKIIRKQIEDDEDK